MTPTAQTFSTTIQGETAWVHDPSFSAGYFHTYDALPAGAAEPHKIHVFLPRGYAGACARYPVAYFNDGDTTFFPDGPVHKSWELADVLAARAATGGRPVIVVAVRPNDRDREYTHVPWLPGRTCCGLAAYVDYLSTQVKPFVDAAYRTQPGPASTVIVGSSHGGLASFYAAATRPEVFGAAVAMSSSFWVGVDGVGGTSPLETSALAGGMGAAFDAARPTLYLDWGLVRDGGAHNALIEEAATRRGREMRDLLVTRHGYQIGQDLFVVEDPAGEHDEGSWGRRIGHALDLVLPP